MSICRLRLKCDGASAETRFRLSAKRTSPFKSAGASVQSITGSRGVRISVSNAAYTMFRGSVKGTGYPLHSPVSPSLPLACVTVCHHISTGMYHLLPRIHCRMPVVHIHWNVGDFCDSSFDIRSQLPGPPFLINNHLVTCASNVRRLLIQVRFIPIYFTGMCQYKGHESFSAHVSALVHVAIFREFTQK